MREENNTDRYKKPYMILLDACDKAVSMLPELTFARSVLIAGMRKAEDAWIAAEETE